MLQARPGIEYAVGHFVNHPIRGEVFLQVVGVLVDTLVYLEVPQSEIDLLAAATNLLVLCDQILDDPTECAALFP